jgi:hypothetical protein
LKKEAKEYADTASGMSKNLKELNDISSDYIISITNQSKELKALNAFSASSAQAIKLLDKTDLTKSGANIQEFLSGITDQFEQMSGVSLPADLDRLRTRLNRLQEDTNNNYKTAMELAGSDKGLQDKAESDRAKSLSQGTSSLIGSYGGIEKVQQDYIGYSLKASKSLADLATAAGKASLAQTALSNKLKVSQFFGSFSKAGQAQAIKDEQETAEKIANIQIKAERTNANSIKIQQESILEQLKSSMSVAGGDIIRKGGVAPAQTGNIREDAKNFLRTKSLDTSIASQILTLANSLESLGAASSIATLKIDAIKESIPKRVIAEVQSGMKSDEAITAEAFRPREQELLRELNILQEQADRTSLLDSQYLSDRLAAKISITEAKADLLKYEKELDSKQKDLDRLSIKLSESNKKKDPDYSKKDAAVQEKTAELATFRLENEAKRKKEQHLRDQENLDIKKTMFEVTKKLSDSLSEQVGLISSYSDYLLSVSTDYSKINELNKLGTQTLLEQYKLQQSILETQLAIERAKEGDPEAAQKIIDLEQKHFAYKLQTHQKLTEALKKETEISLKTKQESGRASDIFGAEGMQQAVTIAMDRIEETMGKSKSMMSQFAVGIIDAADSIVDSFTTMLQKMDETKLRWIDFRDMVRNTLSDMFRNIASDMMKNQLKQGIKSLAAKAGFNTDTHQEKAAKSLQITADSSLNELKAIRQAIVDLLLVTNPNKGLFEELTEGATKSTGINREETYSYARVKTFPYELTWDPAVTPLPDSGLTHSIIARAQAPGSDVKRMGHSDPEYPTTESVAEYLNREWDRVSPGAREIEEILHNENKGNYFRPITGTVVKSAAPELMAKKAGELMALPVAAASAEISKAGTMMQAAIGGLVGALVTGGDAKGALLGIVGGVANSMITGGIMGALGSAFPSLGLKPIAKAKGGIVGPLGDMPLHKYARGGIASSPQLAMFGEGSKNEAYVPLPDNRSIPVTLKGSQGTSVGDTTINVSVTNTGSNQNSTIDVEQSKNFSISLDRKIKAVIQEELMTQMKPRGMLYGR